ncbi:Tetratricopeptide TPR_3 repeat-containing protein [Emticicia oligotrophica DSM 17448]|uniref:Tetratricopeptide TPR_3 repeat-containing protein n=1 Tax=Emticicia oligotrophica (strain DSM 17448 / CIP 109782 / MTCC 6937 / GPTSA100-15) TaxID=929562 RepID=A0ABM5N154_EMTOG|nr:tetratricopeptide repeat protein [Emticicia oligotrophica]AFK03084.1 Tetratricopeptide TPR_3 repeat-containing protein [Emticicia oligotrophica DSM 17448]
MRQILLILLILSFSFVYSQDIKQTFDFANELYNKKDYEGASISYRRVIYFDKADQYRKDCYKNIADCLYETQQFEEAADYYELAFFQQKSDSSKAEVIFRKLSCFLILNSFDYAEIELLSLPSNLTPKQAQRKMFYSAVLNFSIEKYDLAKSQFLSLIDSTNKETKEKIEQLFTKNEKINQLSPRKAKIMSMLIPGLGQFYAGDLKNGFNSMVLTVGIATLGIATAVKSTSPFDVLVTAAPWFQRYYMGGYKKAEQIAINEKKRRRSKVYNQILNELSY